MKIWWLVITTLFCLWFGYGTEIMAETPSSATPMSFFHHSDWPQSFRGVVRTWKFDCLLDEAGKIDYSGISVSSGEFCYCDEGHEMIVLSWEPPYRKDLTPTVSYLRWTPSYNIAAFGNNFVGTRAIYRASTESESGSTEQTFFYPAPYESTFDKSIMDMLNHIDWTKMELSCYPSSDNNHHQDLADGRNSVEVGIYQGMLKLPYQLSTDATTNRAKMLAWSPDHLDSDAKENNKANEGYLPLAFDVFFETSATEHVWGGKGETFFRVLDWKNIILSDGKTLAFPTLAIFENIFIRPKYPGKSAHKISLYYFQVENNPSMVFQLEWKNLLPCMRISDYESGKASISSVIPKEDCEAWLFLKRASELSGEFSNILESDLESKYHAFFEALDTPKECDQLEKINFESSPIRWRQSACVLPGFTQSTLEGYKNPFLLNLVDYIRETSKNQFACDAEHQSSICRQGHVSVSQREQSDAKIILRLVLGLSISTGITICILFLLLPQYQRRNDPSKKSRCKQP